MARQSPAKKIIRQPSWKHHILGYSIGVLLIPFFAIGLLVLYWVYKQQHKYSYAFSDTQISSRDDKYQRNIDLVNIEKVEIHQRWLQQKMGVGDVKLYTSATSMNLQGMENPTALKQLLEKAIAAQKQRHQAKEQTKPKEPKYRPGTMDKMDYLTGLWQQGLVSDEDYKKEKKHFE